MPQPRWATQDHPSTTSAGSDPASVDPAPTYECDGCSRSFEGPPAGSGLYVWTRGDETRYEEPPLCEDCARRITIGALIKWSLEEEDEG